MTPRLTRTLKGQRGFTLAEVLVAVFVIMVGLVAVATGFQYATSGVATGRGETVATFLAEQRVEQLKTVAMTNYFGSPTGPAWAANASLQGGTLVAPVIFTEYCQSSNIGATGSNCQGTTITGTSSYTRVTSIVDNPGGTGCDNSAPALVCKRIRVTVTYRPVTTRGDMSQTRTVDVYAVVAPRS
jgi:prepilin-type N-terminal cleavage/methylation domain-containing protein